MGGQNYNYRMAASRADVDRLFEVVAARRNACARGDHVEWTVPANRVCYGPFGVRRQAGERYCRRCDCRLP